jgi:hypothetical protein
MNDLLLFLVTLIPLLGYIAKDVGARLEKETVHETQRRVATVPTIVVLYSMALTAIISELSGSVPWGLLEGPALFIIQPVSTLILIFLASDSFGAARDTSKREEANKVKVADYIDQQLAGRLRPLEGSVVGVQNGLSELSALKPKVEKMSESVDALATTVLSQVKAMKEIVEQYQLREASYRDIAVQYEKWYRKRAEADLALKDLIIEADDMLNRSDIVMEQMDDLIDLVEGEPPVSGVAGPTEAGAPQGQILSPPTSGETPPPVTHGKLTKVQGMANRERGNNAQLKFAEEVLRGGGRLLDNSIKEGTPDYVFYATGSPETLKVKAVGAFKALTLKEDGTRQRHIPRRKMLAELRTGTKYAVPMILFVMNFTNGRIWAKVIPVNELKDFTGQTTPPMLVESDSQAEKTCKDTLQMALNLL